MAQILCVPHCLQVYDFVYLSTVLLGERAKLERQLEEAHIELADIKATWSNQIKSLETQVLENLVFPLINK